MRRNKISLLFVMATLFCGSVNAQSFDDYDTFEDGWFKVFVRHSSFKSTYTPNFSGYTVNLALKSDRYEPWGARVRYENPTIGDFLYAIVNLSKDVKNGTSTQQVYDDHAHGGGFLGWAQAYMNVVATDKILISPGITGGDYIFGNRYTTAKLGYNNQDPRGYYIAVGPAIMASYAVTDFLWVDAYVNYDITLGKTQDEVVDKDYPNPKFLTFGVDVYTDWLVFGGFRLNKIVDKGYNNDKSSRLDISVGVCF